MTVIFHDERMVVAPNAQALELTEEEARAIYEQLRARFKPAKKKGKPR